MCGGVAHRRSERIEVKNVRTRACGAQPLARLGSVARGQHPHLPLPPHQPGTPSFLVRAFAGADRFPPAGSGTDAPAPRETGKDLRSFPAESVAVSLNVPLDSFTGACIVVVADHRAGAQKGEGQRLFSFLDHTPRPWRGMLLCKSTRSSTPQLTEPGRYET